MRQKAKGAAEAAIFLGLCLVSAFALFGISQRLYTRIDLTRQKKFTLSQATRDVLASLDGPLEVRVYRTRSLQSPLLEAAQGLVDLLEEYQRASGGKLKLSIADPTDESLSAEEREELRNEAQGFGVMEGEATFREADKLEKRRVYLGVSLAYAGRQEVLPFVSDASSLEYDLTRALKRLVAGQDATRPVIGFTTGHGEPSLIGQMTEIFGPEREYRAVPLDKPVPDDVDALVILGPTQEFSARERYEIDQFLMRGRAVILFLSTLEERQQQGFSLLQPVKSGLEELLSAYGAAPTGDVVLDPEYNIPIAIGQRKRQVGGLTFLEPVVANHPLYLVATQFDRQSPLVKDLNGLILPLSTGFDLSGAKEAGLEVTALVQSSEASFRRKSVVIGDPEALSKAQPEDQPGPVVLVASLTGRFTSAFSGKDIPAKEGADANPEAPASSEPAASEPARLDQAEEGARLLVVGTGLSFFKARERANLLFFQNILDWAVLETDLIAIRSREAPDPVLEALEPSTQSLLKWGNVLGVPLALALFGVARWWARRTIRRRA